jgi:large repetitive protein
VDQCPPGSGTDVIQLGGTTYHLQISASTEDANASGDLDVSKPLTIQGNGADATTIDATGSNARLVDVLANAPATIQDLTLTHGSSQGGSVIVGGPGRPGAAVRALSELTLNGVAVTNSHAANAATNLAISGATGNDGGDGGGNQGAQASVSFKIVKR